MKNRYAALATSCLRAGVTSRDHAAVVRALTEAHEAGREEMSAAIEALIVRYVGLVSQFGWEARIINLALDIQHREQKVREEERTRIVTLLRAKAGTFRSPAGTVLDAAYCSVLEETADEVERLRD